MLDLFPPESARRTALFCVAGVAGTVVFCLWVLGAPPAALMLGLAYGSVASLSAAGIVLIYRTQRFINFAALAIGAAGGRVCYNVMAREGVSFAIGLPTGLVIAAVVGLAVEFIIIKRFLNSPRLTLTVASIAIAGFLPGTSLRFTQQVFPFLFPNGEASLDQQLGTFTPKLPLEGLHFQVGRYPLPFGFKHIFAVEAAVFGFALLGAFFRFTRAGVAVRGVADNPDRAKLLGISVGALSTIVWIVAALVSCLGNIAYGALENPAAATTGGVELLLLPLAAAVIARMEKLPVAFIAAICLACMERSLLLAHADKASLFYVIVLVAIGGSLLLQRRSKGRSEKGGDAGWAATSEQRPIPRELTAVAGVRAARLGIGVAVAVVIGLVPLLAPTRLTSTVATTFIVAIVGLSLVVLTGWAGQVSLGQFGFVALGAVLAGGLMADHAWPFWFAAPLAMVVVAAFAVLVGLPALRIQGLFLGVTTLAFAGAVQFVLFDEKIFGFILPNTGIPRPSLPLISFKSERSMYYLCLAFLVLALVVVNNLRKSRTGRALIGARENEANMQSFGINIVRTKLIGFGIAGALSGLAGALLAAQQGGVQATQFDVTRSVNTFIFAVLGGIGSPAGVLLGAAYGNLLEQYVTSPFVRPLVGPGGLILVLLIEPGGLIAIVNRVRDAGLRIVAQRRQLIVPSLFADVDPDALRNKLVPLAEPATNLGLAALPVGTTFQRQSELYANGRKKPLDLPKSIGEIGPAPEPKPGELAGAGGRTPR